MRHSLKLHPLTECAAVSEIDVEVAQEGSQLQLRYFVQGDIGSLIIPDPAPPERTDGLWRHSCFELFVGYGAAEDYLEFNLAPSGQWAAYRFRGYRSGMEVLETQPPSIRTESGDGALVLQARLELDAAPADQPWRLGLSAVIEEVDERLSYWALAHPPGKPDFHHRDCFALELRPAD